MLIVLDPADFTKARLLHSSVLSSKAPKLEISREHPIVAAHGVLPSEGVKALLVLNIEAASDGLPGLITQPLDYTHVPTQERTASDGKTTPEQTVKTEAGAGAVEERTHEPKTNRARAYDSFLRLIVTNKAFGINQQNFEAALPQIMGVVAIAKQLGAISSVRDEIELPFIRYIGSHTFWETIAKHPLQRIAIAVTLRNSVLYEEALKHLVGSSADYKAGIPYPNLPDNLQSIIVRKAQKLHTDRLEIDLELSGLNLTTKADGETIPVGIRQAVTWVTVSLFRDWMQQHIRYLRIEDSPVIAPPQSLLCDHGQRCTTVWPASTSSSRRAATLTWR